MTTEQIAHALEWHSRHAAFVRREMIESFHAVAEEPDPPADSDQPETWTGRNWRWFFIAHQCQSQKGESMGCQLGSVSIRGLRKAHLHQLVSYIRDENRDWYYGNKEHFDSRHRDLLKLAEELERIASDPDIRIAKLEKKT